MTVREQIDPTRRVAALKAWETRRKMGWKPKTIDEAETSTEATVVPKWHTTSVADFSGSISYRDISDSFEDKPWIEKHRPISLQDCVGSVVNYLKAFVKTGSFPLCMIFHGEYGVGKSTCAKALVRDFYVMRGLFKKDATFSDVAKATKVTGEYVGIFPPVLYIDATLSNNVEVIRTRVQNFMQYSAGKWLKFVIVDEADRLGFVAQDAIASLLERHPHTRTIYTTNYLNDIRDRIVSRAAGGVFEFKKPSPEEIAEYLQRILEREHVRIPSKKVLEIATLAPSVRDAVGILQRECALKKAMR